MGLEGSPVKSHSRGASFAGSLLPLLASLTSFKKNSYQLFFSPHPSPAPVGAVEPARATHAIFPTTNISKHALFALRQARESGSHLPLSHEELAHQGLA